MKILIGIPEEHYERFVAACDKKSPEYTMLKNGCIASERDGSLEHRTIQILCDDTQAAELVDAASKLCPEVVPVIANGTPLRPRMR
jgi:hypothetical protein